MLSFSLETIARDSLSLWDMARSNSKPEVERGLTKYRETRPEETSCMTGWFGTRSECDVIIKASAVIYVCLSFVIVALRIRVYDITSWQLE
jgi:hypothetical protein